MALPRRNHGGRPAAAQQEPEPMQAPSLAGDQPDMMAGYGQQPDPFGGQPDGADFSQQQDPFGQPGGADYGQQDPFGGQPGGAGYGQQPDQFGQPGNAYADSGYAQQYGQPDQQDSYGPQPYQEPAQPDYASFQQQAIDYQTDAMAPSAPVSQTPDYDDPYQSAQYGQEAPQPQAPSYDGAAQPHMRPVRQRPAPQPEDDGNVFNSAAAPAGADYGDPAPMDPAAAPGPAPQPDARQDVQPVDDLSGYPELADPETAAEPDGQDDDDGQNGRGKGRHVNKNGRNAKNRPQKGDAKGKPVKPAKRQAPKTKQKPDPRPRQQQRPTPAATGAGGIDPMGILALWASGTGPIGIILSIVAMTRRKLYPVGRYLSTIALVVSILTSIGLLGVGAMVSTAAKQMAPMMQAYGVMSGGSTSGAAQKTRPDSDDTSIAYVEYDWTDGTQAEA